MTASSQIAWPEASLVNKGRCRFYRTPDGDFPSVTTILRVLGLSTDALVAWSAREERKAVLAAAGMVFAEGTHDDGPAGFLAAVEARIGKAKEHQKQMAKAADIGTAAHQRVEWQLRQELGLPVGPEPVLPDPALWAWMAFDSYWKASRLRAVRTEQVVWDAELGYAGTVDIFCEDPERGLGILDVKTSKGTYTDHHLQVVGYLRAARRLGADVKWASLIRLPKNTDDPGFEVVPLGHLYGGQRLSEAELFEAFRAALAAWNVLVRTTL